MKVKVGRPDPIRMRLFWIIATVVALEDTCEEGDCALSLRQLRGQQFEAGEGSSSFRCFGRAWSPREVYCL